MNHNCIIKISQEQLWCLNNFSSYFMETKVGGKNTHANTYIHRHTHTHAHAPVRIPEGISCGTRGWSTQDHKKKSLLFHMNPGFLLYVQIQLEGLEEKTFPCWHLTHLQSLTLRHPNMHATVWDRDEPNKYFPAISPYKKKKNWPSSLFTYSLSRSFLTWWPSVRLTRF